MCLRKGSTMQQQLKQIKLYERRLKLIKTETKPSTKDSMSLSRVLTRLLIKQSTRLGAVTTQTPLLNEASQVRQART